MDGRRTFTAEMENRRAAVVTEVTGRESHSNELLHMYAKFIS